MPEAPADRLAGNTRFTKSYGIVAGVLGAVFLIVLTSGLLRRRKKAYKPETAMIPQNAKQYGIDAPFTDIETSTSAHEMTPWKKTEKS